MENKVAAAIGLALFSSFRPWTPPGPRPRSRPFIFKSPPLAKRAGGRRVFLSRRKITHCPVSGAPSFLLPLSLPLSLPGSLLLAPARSRSISAASLPTEIKAEEVGPRRQGEGENKREREKTGEETGSSGRGKRASERDSGEERGRGRGR